MFVQFLCVSGLLWAFDRGSASVQLWHGVQVAPAPGLQMITAMPDIMVDRLYVLVFISALKP